MGAWSYSPFGNDEACDWLIRVEEEGHNAIRSALEATGGQDYLQEPEGSAAVAAAAYVAALCDGNIADMPEDSLPALERLKSEAGIIARYRNLAVQALDRVLAPESELNELWSEGDEFSNWRQSLLDIQKRLERG